MTAPKIALIRQKYNPAGGAERFVSRAIDALTRGGAALTLITRKWESKEGLATIQVNPFYIGNVWRDWSFAVAVQKLLRHQKFDLVQSHERIAGCDVYRAGDGLHRCYLQRRYAQLGWAGRVALALNPYHHYVVAAEARMFRDARLRAVICNSRMIRDEIIANFHLPAERLALIYNGIDTEMFHPSLRARHRSAMRASLGIAENELLLLLVGSGFERKGVGILLQALAGARLPVRALVLGRDKRAARYVAQADQLGIAARVSFIGAVADVRPYYGAADALIMPVLYDPLPNAALEGMACGLPLITSSSCGAAELLSEGINGYVRDAADVAGFAQAIDALASIAHAEVMGRAARTVAEKYTLDAMARQMGSLYRRLLNNGPDHQTSPESFS